MGLQMFCGSDFSRNIVAKVTPTEWDIRIFFTSHSLLHLVTLQIPCIPKYQ